MSHARAILTTFKLSCPTIFKNVFHLYRKFDLICIKRETCSPWQRQKNGEFINLSLWSTCCLRVMPYSIWCFVLLCYNGVAFASHARFIVEQSERVHSTLGSAHLSAVKSIVRWRQCTSYVLQPLCRPLFLVLLLFCEPAVEKSEVVGYKELTLNWVFKNN